MMDKGTKELIYKTLGPPFTKTLFIEIVKVSTAENNTSSSSRSGASVNPRSVFRPQPYHHPHTRTKPADVEMQSSPKNAPPIPSPSSSSAIAIAPPPPPPWSPWGTQPEVQASEPSKKRKLDELHAFHDPIPIFPKRRAPEPASPERPSNFNNYPPSPPVPKRQNSSTQDSPQRLSPSLAKIVIPAAAPQSRPYPFQNIMSFRRSQPD
jgi:histone demethylase JARID1